MKAFASKSNAGSGVDDAGVGKVGRIVGTFLRYIAQALIIAAALLAVMVVDVSVFYPFVRVVLGDTSMSVVDATASTCMLMSLCGGVIGGSVALVPSMWRLMGKVSDRLIGRMSQEGSGDAGER